MYPVSLNFVSGNRSVQYFSLSLFSSWEMTPCCNIRHFGECSYLCLSLMLGISNFYKTPGNRPTITHGFFVLEGNNICCGNLFILEAFSLYFCLLQCSLSGRESALSSVFFSRMKLLWLLFELPALTFVNSVFPRKSAVTCFHSKRLLFPYTVLTS